jgi:hypothetical protein
MTATKTLHIAWTVDDGPTPHTPAMIKNFNAPNRPATWYIVRDRLNASNIAMYRDLQAAGHEIAIHGLHATQNHLSWFPGTAQTKPSYDDMCNALQDLVDFHGYLVKNGINIKFVRVPYGLQTELIYNLKNAGMSDAKAKDANKIIDGKVQASDSNMYHIVNNNFKSLKSTLSSLNLQLWGGSSSGGISRQSWEAE